ncbi:unnamed protein product [Boreogadus saida]
MLIGQDRSGRTLPEEAGAGRAAWQRHRITRGVLVGKSAGRRRGWPATADPDSLKGSMCQDIHHAGSMSPDPPPRRCGRKYADTTVLLHRATSTEKRETAKRVTGETARRRDPPGDDGETPGDDGVTPGDDGETPGDDGETPGDDGETPGDDGATPGDDGETPGDDGETPGDDGSTPGDDGETPGDDGETPGDDGETPGDDGETPGDDGETPGDDGVTPGDDGVTPGDDGVTPGRAAGKEREARRWPSLSAVPIG